MSSLVRFSAAWLAFMAMLLGSAANAADLYWSGTGTWDTTTANWGNAPGTYTGSTWSNDPPDSAIFEGAAGTVALGAAITAAGLTFSTTDYTVTSGTLTLAGTPSISAGTGISATIESVIAGGDAITKTGSGTLTLSGGNTFTNNTIVSAGTVRIGNSSAFGPQGIAAPVTQVVVESGGTVDFNGVIDAGYGYTIAGAGDGAGALVNNGAAIGNTIRQAINVLLSADATIGGTGNWSLLAGGYGPTSLDLAGHTLTKAGANTIGLLNSTLTAGSINVSEGRLDVLSNTTSAAGVAVSLDDVASAELRVNNGGTLTIGSLAGGGTTGGGVNLANGSLNVGSLGTDTTFSGVISGGGPLIKSGSGTLTLNGVSNYSGGTTINAGTLLAGNADALGTSGAISVGASGTLGIGDGVTFTRPFSLTAGGRVRTGDNSTVGLPSVAALAGWESQSSTGDQTLAEILDASGSTTPTALTSAWTANPGGYFSDILTLEGTGADNTFVLSMEYSAASDGLNIWYRADELGAFAPLGTSFVGNVPWDNSFTTVGQYGVDTSAGTVWAVTDHNSQFAVVPEPGTLGLSAMCLAGGLWYLRQRRA